MTWWLTAVSVLLGLLLTSGDMWGLSAKGPGDAEPLAEVDGEPISAEALEQALGLVLYTARERIYLAEEEAYRLKRQRLEELIAQKLLEREAARRGVSVQGLVEGEVHRKVRVTEREIETFYQERKDAFKGHEPAAAREAIRKYLHQKHLATERDRFVQTLRARSQVAVRLTPPAPPRVTVSGGGASIRGPKRAPITIVEFSDFQCPFCRSVQADLQRVLDAYPKNVKLAYRHFPLENNNPLSRLAAEASECAGEQGKFWPYHDKLFANASQLSAIKLRALAQELGLDPQAFARCVESGKYRAKVAHDVAEGTKAGVTGTPTFFINGRVLIGAHPFVAFQRLIEEELHRR